MWIFHKLETQKVPIENYQPLDSDLTAIANLTGGGLLQRNSDNTWELNSSYRRPIYVNSDQVSGLEASTSNALNLVAGSNIQITTGNYAGNGIPVTITATDTKYAIATTSVAGLVKPASVITEPLVNPTTNTPKRYYDIQMSSSGRMFVNVPWTNTEYSAGNGLTLTNTSFSVNTLTTGEIDTILANS